jgi:tetratricopeptide (TPR) repeat protein
MSNPTALIAGLSTILFACSALLVSAQPSEPDSFKEIGNAQSSDYPLELTNDQDIGNDLDAVARLHEINGNYTLAIDNYLNFVLEVQEQQGSYSAALIESMIGLTRSYQALGDYAKASEYGARAQHLTHRNEGVYSQRQLEIIDLMTDAFLAQGDPEQADKTQKFSLFIAQHHVAEDSLEAIAALNKLGQWYVDSGQFTRADTLLNTQAEIVTNAAGPLDPHHLPIIIERAKLKRLRRICCSHIVMQKALPILQNNPSVPTDLRIETYLALGDSYTDQGKTITAADYYRQAWQLMDVSEQTTLAEPTSIAMSRALITQRGKDPRLFAPERDHFGNTQFSPISSQEQIILETLPPQSFALPLAEKLYTMALRDKGQYSPYENREKVYRVVGHPYRFVHRQIINILPSGYHSDSELSQLVVDLNFTVGSRGDLYDIQILTPQVPSKLRRLLRESLRRSVYRPGIKNGEPVETKNVQLKQTFKT